MNKIFKSLFMAIVLLSATAYAEVSIVSQSFQKSKKKKWIKTEKVVPGSVVMYRNTLANDGNQKAENLVVVNAVSKYMHYIKKSAKCKSKCAITYSIDGGKTFKKPKKLLLRDKKTKKIRKAMPSEYTTIKWVIKKLKGGKKTTVQYKARLI